MGKGFNNKRSGGKTSSQQRSSTSITRKNVSKKVADVRRKEKAYEKSKKHMGRVETKKREFELRRLARKKSLEGKAGGAAAARAKLEDLAKKRARKATLAGSKAKNESNHGDPVWEDIDEHERDVFDKDGYFDVMENEAEISQSDMQLLEKMQS